MNWSVPTKHHPGTLQGPTEECRQKKDEPLARKVGQQLALFHSAEN